MSTCGSCGGVNSTGEQKSTIAPGAQRDKDGGLECAPTAKDAARGLIFSPSIDQPPPDRHPIHGGSRDLFSARLEGRPLGTVNGRRHVLVGRESVHGNSPCGTIDSTL